MSARVCSPPMMDLSRNSDLHLSSSCTTSSLASSNKELVGTAKRNARRNLFGPPDPRSVQFAREKVEEIKAGSKKYWNFDFDRELPLEGRYKWERVGAGERVGEVPTAYACQRLPFLGSSSSSTATTTAKQFKTSSSSTPSSSSSSSTTTAAAIADRLYYIPATTSNSQNERREPLLSVSAGVITRSQSCTSSSLAAAATVSRIAPQAGTSVAISSSESTHQSSNVEIVDVEEEEARTRKTIASSTGRSGRHCSENPSIPLSTPSKDGSTPPSGNQVSSSSSSLSFITPSAVDAMKTTDDVKCKVQVKSTKQTTMSDYYKERKRRAAPEATSSIVEKKAAL